MAEIAVGVEPRFGYRAGFRQTPDAIAGSCLPFRAACSRGTCAAWRW